MTSVIEARSLTKRFGVTTAVESVDLRVESGEIVGLVGVNGAGKTTLLRMLAGIAAPSRGKAFVDGFSVEPEEVEGRRRLAFASDIPALFDTLTLDEHLTFFAELYGVEDWREKADAALRRLDMVDRRDHVVGTLSLGLRQRAALCCALFREPRAFLLDEPLNGLDPPTRRRLWDALAEAAERGAAVILSSHQLELVERVCTRFVLLHEGRVRWDGSADRLRSEGRGEDALEDLFMTETSVRAGPVT